MYIRAVLIRENVWIVVDGQYKRPQEPSRPQGTPAAVVDDKMIPAAPPSKEELAKYNQEYAAYQKVWVEWQNMNMKAFSTISLLVEPEMLVHINEMNDAMGAMQTLYKICG